MQKVSESQFAYRDGRSGVKYMIRGPMIDWGIILMLPGETLSGHYHEQTEETFYVAEGSGVFVINGERHTAQPGDALRLEPQERHEIRNEGGEPLKLIFIKCPYLPQDRVSA